jgi:agmatinase
MLASTDPVPIGRPTFLGADRATPLDPRAADLVVVGIPYTTPSDLAGSRAPSSAAPPAVRQQSLRLADRLDHYDFDFGGDLLAGRRVRLVDWGDVGGRPGRYAENAGIATAVIRAILDRGAVPIVLGGDHAAAIPALRAYSGRGPLAVVHLGPTLDWCDEVNGVEDGPRSAMRRAAEVPGVTSMVQIGLRGGSREGRREVEAALAFGSVLVRAEEVHELGVREALRRVPAASGYYVSLDATALDPAIAPGVEPPAFGGLTYFEATNLLKGVAARGPVVGFDLVGIVPAHDLNDQTSLLGARLILNLVGALAHAGRIGEPVRDAALASRPDRRPAPAEPVRELVPR